MAGMWLASLDNSVSAVPLITLKARSEFLAVRGGSRASFPAFLIETRPRAEKPGAEGVSGPRFGFTITKKLGNAVTRNRIRRRLKAAIGQLPAGCMSPAHDYVVVARQAAVDIPFAALQKDLERALQRVHHAGAGRPGRRPGRTT